MSEGPARTGAVHARRLARLFERRRIPASGSLNLTHRCNLRCRHCYLGDERSGAGARELPTDRWLSLLGEIAGAGCLELLISGGEPLLRPDFATIYRRARELGMVVTVFTNGTLVDPSTVGLFRDLPPHAVEVSLYGATEATCERVTGVAGALARCSRGLDLLLGGGIRVTLKTVVLRENVHEIGAMRAIARSLGVPFRVDPALTPTLDGSPAPLASRVSVRDAVREEFADPDDARQWREFFASHGTPPVDGALVSCGAGLATFHVDARGGLLPCLMLRKPRFDLGGGSFLEGWRDVIPRVREAAASPGNPCPCCELRAICGCCPAVSLLETGDAQTPPAYHCELGRERLHAIRTPPDCPPGGSGLS